MKKLTFEQILKKVIVNGGGVSWDSRNLKVGDIFVALKTEDNDGHDYLKQAAAKRASGAVVEKAVEDVNLGQCVVEDTWKAVRDLAKEYRDEFEGTIIGITGSCGKTTTKDLLALLLGEGVTRTHLNENNLLGVPKTLFKLDLDKDAFGVVEAGVNELGEMEQIAQTMRPDHAILTNVMPVHLEGLKSVETIADEKAWLFRETKEGGVRMLPGECWEYEYFREHADELYWIVKERKEGMKNCIVYSIEKEGAQAVIKLGGVAEFEVPMRSNGMLENAVFAIAMAYLLGVEEKDLQARLKEWKASEFRGEWRVSGKKEFYLDCYNSNPMALKDAQGFFARHFDTDSGHLYVLGCMGELGDRAKELHYESGKSLSVRPQDRVLVIGDEAEDLRRGLVEAGTQVKCVENRDEIKSEMADFEGAIFVKGSKKYRLWELLPSE